MIRKLIVVGVLVAVLLGTSALFLSPNVMAGKGGKGKGKPKPPPCECAETIGDCVLISCGQFDCVYQCPLP